jgi:GH18 family chitinase
MIHIVKKIKNRQSKINCCSGLIIMALFVLIATHTQCNENEKPPLSEDSTVEGNEPEAQSAPYVSAYLVASEYRPNTVRWNAITHLNIAFLYPNPDGTLSDTDLKNTIAQITEEAHRNHVKVIVSIRDRAAGQFAEAVEKKKSILADNLLQYVKNNHLDGFDIDFEDWNRAGIAQHLVAFAKELYGKKEKDILQTCAVNTYDRGYTAEWHQYFDLINVMTYDWHGPWNTEGQHSPYSESIAAMGFWINKMAAPPSKLLLGLPFYGYSWNEGDSPGEAYRYSQILDKYPDEDVANKDQIDRLYYNGKATIVKKCRWAIENKIAGVMIWQIGQDAASDKDSLLEAIGTAMRGADR